MLIEKETDSHELTGPPWLPHDNRCRAGIARDRPRHGRALRVRADFPITRNHTFLNTAWIGPIPQVARDAAVEYADETLMWGYPQSIDAERNGARRVC